MRVRGNTFTADLRRPQGLQEAESATLNTPMNSDMSRTTYDVLHQLTAPSANIDNPRDKYDLEVRLRVYQRGKCDIYSKS